MTFKALLTSKDGEKILTNLVELKEEDLMTGDVTAAVEYSTVNYKDGMALTRAVSQTKKEANAQVVDLLLPNG